jgi:uncharacterized membrane protein
MILFLVAGVALDLTRLFLARRSLQSVADAASLRAAATLDEGALYRSSGVAVRILPEAARANAARVIALRGIPAETRISIEEGGVTVALRMVVPTTLLRSVGIDSLPAAVTSTAVPIEGEP